MYCMTTKPKLKIKQTKKNQKWEKAREMQGTEINKCLGVVIWQILWFT